MRRFPFLFSLLPFFVISLSFFVSSLSSVCYGQASANPAQHTLRFDSNGYIRANMVARGDTAYTVECWVKPDAKDQKARIFSFAASDTVMSYGLYMHNGTGRPGMCASISLRDPDNNLWNNCVTGTTARLRSDRWTHVALTRSGLIWKLYRNGEYVGYASRPVGTPAFKVLIGKHFSGKIADLRVWTVARSQDSIRSRMYTRLSANEPGLLIYYDGSVRAYGSKICNASKLGNPDSLDGVLTGNVVVDSISNDAPPLRMSVPNITILSMPRPLQFFARDANDSAHITIAGTARSGVYDSAIVEIERNDTLVRTLRSHLDESMSFQLTASIHAELSQYSLRLLLKHGDTTWVVREANDLVCGDAFLVTGQSNSHPADTAIIQQSPYLRTFGVQTTNSNLDPYDPADTLWGIANGHGFGQTLSGPYLTGVWGYHIQERLMQKYHLPIFILNGGAGNSTIEANLPPGDPTDLKTIYGRTRYRALKSGLDNYFKAIFWYQGESNTISNYYKNFQTLYSGWLAHYPNAKKFYVFQVRPSWCGAGLTGALRNLQRTLADSLPNIRVMSTASTPGHNGCHFSADGYIAIGESILPWVEHDFYGGTDTVNADAPMIKSAAFTTVKRNCIALTFKGNNLGLHIIGDTLASGESLKNYIFLDSTQASIQSVTISQDTVYLNLSGPSSATSVTYLPEQYFNGTIKTYEGPTIVNSRNIGIFTFYKVRISIPPTPQNSDVDQVFPSDFEVYPNPFSSKLHIHFSLHDFSFIDLTLIDAVGRSISNIYHGEFEPGTHTLEWSLQDHLPNQALFLRFSVGGVSKTIRLLQHED